MSSRTVIATGLAFYLLSATPAGAAEPMERYVVQRGDTLYGLAERYFVRVGDYRTVQRLNRVSDPRRLPVGKQLKVPARLLRSQVIEAKVAGYKGQVSVTLNGRPAPLAVGVVLKEGSIVSTGPNAFLRVNLPDGTHISVPSQSRVRLGRLRAVEMTGVVQRELEVQQGRLESEVTPLRGPRDSYIVRTPMSVSAVRGTQFRVAYDPVAERANTEVIEGLVAVAGAGEKEAVSGRFGTIATAQGVSDPIGLTPPPSLDNPGRVQDEPTVRFQIQGPPVAGGYQVRLAADAGFVEVLSEEEASDQALNFEALDDGVYFIRLSAMGDQGLLGLPATYAFERRLNTLTTSAPTSSQDGGFRRYKFRWDAAGQGARTYRLQLFRDGASAPVVDEAGLTAQELVITDLPPGVYNWRVMSRTFARGGFTEKWSNLERFEIGH